MKFSEIECMPAVNDTDPSKVAELVESIKLNGWTGCPILVLNDELLTGSHRLAALKIIADEDYDLIYDVDVAEDVTDIVNKNMEAYEEEHGWCPDIDYRNIGWLLKGSWVEEYAAEIEEW